MCTCRHTIHFSLVALIVSVLAVSLYTSAVATNHWARQEHVNVTKYDINLGLFRSCSELNNTCSNIHVRFHGIPQKGALMAAAIVHIFALIGMWFFLLMSVLFTCGLFDDDHLVRVSIITAFVSGMLSALGLLMYISSVMALDFSLNWSTALAALGCLVNLAAACLMCVGQKRSKKKKKPCKKQPKTAKSGAPVEEIQMQSSGGSLGNHPVWATGGV